MPPINSKIILVTACIVGVAVLGLFIIWPSSSSSRVGCESQGSEPSLNIENVRPIESFSNSALTKFAGYIIYEPISGSEDVKSKYTYMPLVINSQSVTLKVDENNTTKTSRLSLSFECASIVIELDETASKITTKSFHLDLVTPNGNINHCYFDVDISYQHYRCNQERFKCLTKEKTDSGEEKTTLVAVLDAKVFEFEIGGDPELTRSGQFTNPAHDCRERNFISHDKTS